MDTINEQNKLQSLLLSGLGLPFLSYLLNATPETVGQRLNYNKQMSQHQEVALDIVVTILGQLGEIDHTKDPLWYLSMDVFGLYPETNGHTSWANTIRETAGGAVPSVSKTGDKVKDILSGYANELYPLFLLPKNAERFDPFQPSLSRPVFRHPRKDDLEKAILADKLLGKLFPNREGEIPSGLYISSSGHGGGIQLAILPENLLKAAWKLAQASDPNPGADDLVSATHSTIDTLRAALTEAGGKITTRIGISGVVLKDIKEIEFPWGKLRAASQSDLADIPPGINTQSTHSLPDGKTVLVDSMGNAVLETEMTYQIRVVENLEGQWPKDMRAFEDINAKIETIQTGLVLSLKSQSGFPKAIFRWRSDFDPMGYHGLSWSDPKSGPFVAPSIIGKSEGAEWEKWTGLVDSQREKSLEVAIHRLLRAVNERRDATDMLIDSVIAWESIVGSRSGEPTLRVSTALAWLLEAKQEERVKLQKQVKDLYDLRSDVVHGNRNLGSEEASAVYEQAIGLTIKALSALFTTRADLLKECKNSTERSNRLIVGG